MQDTADIPVSGLQENWKKKSIKILYIFVPFNKDHVGMVIEAL